MSSLMRDNLKNIHSRNIEISTYCWDADHVLVVGAFREQREVGFVNQFTEQIESGIYHHMKIELLIETESMTIKDMAVSLPKVPRGDCPAMLNSLDGIKGMSITRGFSRAIKEMVGGSKGCTHLNTLLLAMVPAAMQGAWVNMSWHQKGPQEPNPRDVNNLINSCWTWREDGPLMAEIKQRFGDDCCREESSPQKKEP